MLNKGPSVPPIVATGVLCLVIGGVVGFYARDPKGSGVSTGPSASGMGGGQGGMKGGQGGQGGGPPASLTALPRLVRNLDTVQKMQNQGLTAQQAQELLPLLKSITVRSGNPIAEYDATLPAIEKVLTADQKQALADMSPQRGGGGGGRPGMGGGPPSSGGGGAGGAKGGGMGAPQDVLHPFDSERNKKALQDLITELENKK